MNADGSGVVRLTENPANDFWPAWSPDGTKIAFASRRGADPSDIWTINPNGTAPFRVDGGEDIDEHAAWSPDGRSIVTSSLYDFTSQIWILTADGGGASRLTERPEHLPNSSRPGGPPARCQPARAATCRRRRTATTARVSSLHRPAVVCATVLGVALGNRDAQGRPAYEPRSALTRAQMATFLVALIEWLERAAELVS